MKKRNIKRMNYFVLLIFLFTLILSLPASAENKTYKWRIGTLVAETVPAGAGMYEFAQLVEERTNGQIRMDCFPVQQLGFWMDEFDNISKGSQEMGFLPTSPRYSQLSAVFVPFVITSWDAFYNAAGRDGFLFKYVDKGYEQLGVKLLSLTNCGFDGYSGMKGPVVYPEDIKKLKIKTRVGYPISKIYFEKLGPVVSVDMGEVFTALQLGTIGCQADQAVQTVYTQFRDVTKYFTDINSAPAILTILMNKKLWDSLSPELQKIIQETADEVGAKISHESQVTDEEYYKKFEEEGVVVTRLTPEQREVWVKLATEPGGMFDISREKLGSETVDFLLENLNK
ncbi:TRAP transporter substrate-binding protein [Candidatus Atribacteria bacterium 1244-E10-H5-B2]|nr:MAG: TRAP transporter substrate-binding protein [Candidatus Atribacteria bacterium 1244-E10-H5-B2]